MKTFLAVLAVGVLLLAVLVLPLLGPIEPGRGQETRSMARVQTVASAITQLASRADLGSYPPNSIIRLRDMSQTNVGAALGEGNEFNRGIECVFVALHLQGVTIRLDLPDDAIANTDGDALERNVTRLDSAELFEIVDAWGNPRSFQVFSAGADGVFNTADDLGNWERSPE